MNKKLLMIKIASVLALAGATVGGAAIGITSAHPAASQVSVEKAINEQTPPENPETDLRNTEYVPESEFGIQDLTWDSMAKDKQYTKLYDYQLNKKNRLEERSYYTYEAVERQARTLITNLNDSRFPYKERVAAVVYNFVQMIDDQNTDDVVAWESIGTLKEGERDIGMIWLEGGPVSNPIFDLLPKWRIAFSDLGAFYYLKQAQFGLYPKQVVGRYGASATNNFYMQRIRSDDTQKLKNYKQAYESGRLSNSTLLWGIGGDLDFNMGELFGAMSIASIIIATARTNALTKQLYESGFERVSLVGISYGMTLGLSVLANDLSLLDKLYRVSLGENVLTSTKPFYRNYELTDSLIDTENKKDNKAWNRSMWDINAAYNIKNMLAKGLRPDGKPLDNQYKVSAHIAKDDNHNWNDLYDDEEKFFKNELGIKNYVQHEVGGHGIWGASTPLQEWVFGLRSWERRYK